MSIYVHTVVHISDLLENMASGIKLRVNAETPYREVRRNIGVWGPLCLQHCNPATLERNTDEYVRIISVSISGTHRLGTVRDLMGWSKVRANGL